MVTTPVAHYKVFHDHIWISFVSKLRMISNVYTHTYIYIYTHTYNLCCVIRHCIHNRLLTWLNHIHGYHMLVTIISLNVYTCMSSEGCIQKFTNTPLQGFYCNNGHYQTLQPVTRHACTHACITSLTCRALSYNSRSRLCLLSSEPCPVSEEHPEFELMVFRYNMEEPCGVWISNDEETEASRLVASQEKVMSVVL